MYGLFRFDNALAQITLPSPPGVGRPWGTPRNVYVVGARHPVLVDTGWSASRAALTAALGELGIAPDTVSTVLLTDLSPAASGNLELFPNATRLGRDVDDARHHHGRHVQQKVSATTTFMKGLLDAVMAPEVWSDEPVEAFAASYTAHVPARRHFIPLRDGMSVETSAGPFDVISTPGVEPTGTTFLLREHNWLFCGEILNMVEPPMVTAAESYGESLSRVVQTRPAAICPARGGIERSYHWTFRSTSLFYNNLLSNIPFALDGPRAVPEIVERDLGYLPDDLVRFAGTCQIYRAVLEELVRAGVAERAGEGTWARYTMERPSRLS